MPNGDQVKGKAHFEDSLAATQQKQRNRYSGHTVLLHDSKELDNDLGARADEHLALAGLLSIVDALQSIVENRCADHVGGCGRCLFKQSFVSQGGSEAWRVPFDAKEKNSSKKGSARSVLRRAAYHQYASFHAYS